MRLIDVIKDVILFAFVLSLCFVVTVFFCSGVKIKEVESENISLFESSIPSGSTITNVFAKTGFLQGNSIEYEISLPANTDKGWIDSMYTHQEIEYNTDNTIVNKKTEISNDDLMEYVKTYGKSNVWVFTTIYIVIFVLLMSFSIFTYVERLIFKKERKKLKEAKQRQQKAE